MRRQVYIMILILSVTFSSWGLHGQTGSKPFFIVEGEVRKPLKLTMNDLLNMKQAEVTINDREGKKQTFKGVMLIDILDSAGVSLGKELRGKNLLKYIRVKATDGYEVVFSLAEVDTAFTNQTILLAYQVDGNFLPKGVGPFRLVAPYDKRLTRWVREIAAIKILLSIDQK